MRTLGDDDLPAIARAFSRETETFVTNSSVLVLNRNYQPVHVTSVKRAFALLYIGAARVIEPDFSTFDFDSWADLGYAAEHDVIHTMKRAIRIPRVIVLQMYDRLPRTKVRFSRLNIYARDDQHLSVLRAASCRAPCSTSTTSSRAPRAAARPGRTSSAAACRAT